jgi:hypothetical protein
MRTIACILIVFGLSGAAISCQALRDARRNLADEVESGRLGSEAVDAVGGIISHPTIGNTIAEVGGFLSYLVSAAFGGLLLRNRKSDSRKFKTEMEVDTISKKLVDLSDKLGTLESENKTT